MAAGVHSISGKAKVAGIMGWPVGHSKSPALHGFWLHTYGVDGAYVPMPVAPENLAQALKALFSLGFKGVNLTVPHKETAMLIVDEITPTAKAVGAINTVFVLPDGRLQGTNTDAYGFIENLRQADVASMPNGDLLWCWARAVRPGPFVRPCVRPARLKFVCSTARWRGLKPWPKILVPR